MFNEVFSSFFHFFCFSLFYSRLFFRSAQEQRIVHDKNKAEAVTDFISRNAEKIEPDVVQGKNYYFVIFSFLFFFFFFLRTHTHTYY
jgi:hypothetical protein